MFGSNMMLVLDCRNNNRTAMTPKTVDHHIFIVLQSLNDTRARVLRALQHPSGRNPKRLFYSILDYTVISSINRMAAVPKSSTNGSSSRGITRMVFKWCHFIIIVRSSKILLS